MGFCGVKWIVSIFTPKCKHAFYIEDMELTNYEPLEKPNKDDGYKAWSEYFTGIYKHRSHTQRVKCDCFKCGETKFAHCGIDLGKLIRKADI